MCVYVHIYIYIYNILLREHWLGNPKKLLPLRIYVEMEMEMERPVSAKKKTSKKQKKRKTFLSCRPLPCSPSVEIAIQPLSWGPQSLSSYMHSSPEEFLFTDTGRDIYIYIYTHMYVYMYVCMYVCIYIYIYNTRKRCQPRHDSRGPG